MTPERRTELNRMDRLDLLNVITALDKRIQELDAEVQKEISWADKCEVESIKLRRALENYSRRGHHDTCDAALDCGNFECNCGLREAEAALKGEDANGHLGAVEK